MLGRAFGVFSRIRKSEDHRPLIDARHGLDHFLRESATDSADADDCCRLDALDCSHKIPGGRVLMRVWLLEVDKVLAGRLQQAIDVKHVDPRLRFFQRHPLCNERRTEQVGKADTG